MQYSSGSPRKRGTQNIRIYKMQDQHRVPLFQDIIYQEPLSFD